jgi:hypothetical protein
VFTILVEATVDVPCERIAKSKLNILMLETLIELWKLIQYLELRKPINHSRWDGALGEVREIDYLQKDTKLVLFTYPPGTHIHLTPL